MIATPPPQATLSFYHFCYWLKFLCCGKKLFEGGGGEDTEEKNAIFFGPNPAHFPQEAQNSEKLAAEEDIAEQFTLYLYHRFEDRYLKHIQMSKGRTRCMKTSWNSTNKSISQKKNTSLGRAERRMGRSLTAAIKKIEIMIKIFIWISNKLNNKISIFKMFRSWQRYVIDARHLRDIVDSTSCSCHASSRDVSQVKKKNGL